MSTRAGSRCCKPNPPAPSPALLSGSPSTQVIYIAPLKALVRERVKDWGAPDGFCARLGKKMVELTGDYTPDMVRERAGAAAANVGS